MERNYTYLAFTIKILDIINLWPTEAKTCLFIKKYWVLTVFILTGIPVMADIILQLHDDDYSIISFIHSTIGMSALLITLYMSINFMIKSSEIKRLTEGLEVFEEFLVKSKIVETENKARFHTRIFIMYGIIGSIIYFSFPLFTYQKCNRNKNKHMIKYGIPCGTVVDFVFPVKQDTFFLIGISIGDQIVVSTFGTIIVMTLTMLVCGILLHVSANLKYLKNMILEISDVPENQIIQHVNFCVKYHTTICNFTDRINDAFSTMMLIHITWTSVVISLLGFGLVMGTDFFDCVKYSIHLGGWLGMLFLICFYGQILMDDSSAISGAVYDTLWYEKSPSTRKCLVLMLLRSQRPLVLKAAGINVMSLATFLGVISLMTALLKPTYFNSLLDNVELKFLATDIFG